MKNCAYIGLLFAVVICFALPPATYPTTQPSKLYGYVSTVYRPSRIAGWDYNRCVPDPIGQINNIRQRGEVIGFNMGAGYPDVSERKDHWQGLQRLGVANRRYFVIDSKFGDASRFAVVHMATRTTTGQRLRGNRMSTTTQDWNNQPSLSDAIIHTQIVNTSFKHPGGMQALGRYLFVPLEEGGGRARVFNYDMGSLTDPWTCDPGTGAGCPKKLWGFVFATNDASLAALAKLANGRYLLVTARHDSNVLEFYLSKPGYHISHPDVFGAVAEWGNYEALFNRASYPAFRTYYQNLNLLAACPGPGYEIGQLYLLGTTSIGALGMGIDIVDLFELSLKSIPDPDISGTDYTAHVRLVAEKVLYCTAVSSGRQCNFNAAAGAYVDPDGRLILYAAEHDNDGPPGSGPRGSVKMMEFRGADHLDSPDVAGKQGCSSLNDAFVELYDGYLGTTPGPTTALPTTQNGIFVQYIDRTKRSYAKFDTAYNLNDNILSIRYCIPEGYKYRIFSDSDYSMSSTYINTFRGDSSIPGSGNPSNGSIQGFRWSTNYRWSSGCFMTATGSKCL